MKILTRLGNAWSALLSDVHLAPPPPVAVVDPAPAPPIVEPITIATPSPPAPIASTLPSLLGSIFVQTSTLRKLTMLTDLFSEASKIKTLIASGHITEIDGAQIYDEVTSLLYNEFPSQTTREVRSIAVAENARLQWLATNLSSGPAPAPAPTGIASTAAPAPVAVPPAV